jgi:hypothetical protein
VTHVLLLLLLFLFVFFPSHVSVMSASNPASQPPPDTNSPPVVVSTHYQTPPLVTFTNFNPTKLTNVNYPVWLPQIVPHLKGGNIFGYVDGSTPCPPPIVTSTKDGVSTTSPNPAFLHWSMQDQLLLGAINSALSKKMLTHVTRCATSRDAWTTFETLFTSQTKARTMQVHYQLATLKKGSSSIADYYHTFQTLCDALAVVGQPLNGFEKVSFLLAGLGSDFDPFITSVTTRAEPLSVDEIYGHLFSHEMRFEQHQASLDLSVAGANFASRGNSSPHSNRGMRGSRGNHSSGRGFSGTSRPFRGRGRGPSSGRGSSSNRPLCQVCNRYGHVALDCYNRFNEAYTREKPSQAHAYLSTPSSSTDQNWYPDSGVHTI